MGNSSSAVQDESCLQCWSREKYKKKPLIGENLESEEGSFVMTVMLVNNTDIRLWVLPSYTMREIDAIIVEGVGKQRPLYNHRTKKLVKSRINAFLDWRTAWVDWDVTMGEMNTNYLMYDQDETFTVSGPAGLLERYVHTKERIKKYERKNNIFNSKPAVFYVSRRTAAPFY